MTASRMAIVSCRVARRVRSSRDSTIDSADDVRAEQLARARSSDHRPRARESRAATPRLARARAARPSSDHVGVVARASAGPAAICQANATLAARRRLVGQQRAQGARSAVGVEWLHDDDRQRPNTPSSHQRAAGSNQAPRYVSSDACASSSPRPRRAGASCSRPRAFAFDVDPVDVDETRSAGRSAGARTSSGGARARRAPAPARHPDAAVLGADTVVVVDGEVLGKPRDEADARADAATAGGPRARGADRRRGGVGAAGMRVARRADDGLVRARCPTTKIALVRRERRADGQGRRLRDSGPGVAVHPADRRLVLERRRAAGGGGGANCSRTSGRPGSSSRRG